MRRHQSTKPMRKCIGCRESFPQDELKRFTIRDGIITADESYGRGFYLCRKQSCMEAAIKSKAFNRVAGTKVDAETIKGLMEDSECQKR
ncbi:MAG: YlxR family protein [Mogibacterium sp.]|nr:YlxR family protein [Mogibacterium sp.]